MLETWFIRDKLNRLSNEEIEDLINELKDKYEHPAKNIGADILLDIQTHKAQTAIIDVAQCKLGHSGDTAVSSYNPRLVSYHMTVCIHILTAVHDALDNAIEGCERSNADEKHIYFSINEEKDTLSIIVTNTSDEVNTEVLTTSKRKSGLHGIGISSIRSAAERLQGVSTFRYQDGIFTLRVVILNC